jgi:hypothetical protein
MQSLKEKRREAGRRGGLATLARHGVDHFRRIGTKGARVFWKRYRFSPVGTSQFAIVRRDNNSIVAYLDGMPF